MPRKADEEVIPGRTVTEENAARRVRAERSGRRWVAGALGTAGADRGRERNHLDDVRTAPQSPPLRGAAGRPREPAGTPRSSSTTCGLIDPQMFGSAAAPGRPDRAIDRGSRQARPAGFWVSTGSTGGDSGSRQARPGIPGLDKLDRGFRVSTGSTGDRSPGGDVMRRKRSRHRRRLEGNLADVVSRPETDQGFPPSSGDLDIAPRAWTKLDQRCRNPPPGWAGGFGSDLSACARSRRPLRASRPPGSRW